MPVHLHGQRQTHEVGIAGEGEVEGEYSSFQIKTRLGVGEVLPFRGLFELVELSHPFVDQEQSADMRPGGRM
jgi:hypothetical protein